MKIKWRFKIKNINSLQKWCNRFLKWNLLILVQEYMLTKTFRILPRNKKLIKFNENLRKNNDFKHAQMANKNEAPLFMNMLSSKTIAKFGLKKVNIKAYDQERVDVTLTQWIVADGTKLSPQLVFKWNLFGKVKKRIRSIL